MAIGSCCNLNNSISSQSQRLDLDSMVSSGLFEECVLAVVHFAAGGVEGMHDTSPSTLYNALKVILACRHHSGCEARIRSIAAALAFCLENDMDYMPDLGLSSGACAAALCCSVFGRDENSSEFTLTSQHVDLLLTLWSHIVRGEGLRAAEKPSPDKIKIVDLCVSDKNKPLLLENVALIPYLVDALLLDPEHPRAGMKSELKAWCQQYHAEALAQLAMHPEGDFIGACISVSPQKMDWVNGQAHGLII